MTVELAVTPADATSAGGTCESAFTEEVEGLLSAEVKEAVENGVQSSYLQGIQTTNKGAPPLQDVNVYITCFHCQDPCLVTL